MTCNLTFYIYILKMSGFLFHVILHFTYVKVSEIFWTKPQIRKIENWVEGKREEKINCCLHHRTGKSEINCQVDFSANFISLTPPVSSPPFGHPSSLNGTRPTEGIHLAFTYWGNPFFDNFSTRPTQGIHQFWHLTFWGNPHEYIFQWWLSNHSFNGNGETWKPFKCCHLNVQRQNSDLSDKIWLFWDHFWTFFGNLSLCSEKNVQTPSRDIFPKTIDKPSMSMVLVSGKTIHSMRKKGFQTHMCDIEWERGVDIHGSDEDFMKTKCGFNKLLFQYFEKNSGSGIIL